MNYSNKIKIIDQTQLELSKDSFTEGSVVEHEGRTFQLWIGKHKTSSAKRFAYFVKAFACTLFTLVIGLAFKAVRHYWSIALHSKHTIKRYVEIFPRSLAIKNDENPASIKPSDPTDREEENILELLLKTLRESAARDLHLDEEFIENKYSIKATLATLNPEEQKTWQEKFNHVLNHAFLQRWLQQKGKIVEGEDSEIIFLTCLGYPINETNYHDKEKIYSLTQEGVRNKLTAAYYKKSLSEFKEIVSECAARVRLQTLNMADELQIQKFCSTIPFLSQIKNEIEEIAKNTPLTLPPDFPFDDFSLAAKSLKMKLNTYTSNLSQSLVKHLFSLDELKNAFWNTQVTCEDYCLKLIEVIYSRLEDAKARLIVKCQKVNEKPAVVRDVNFYQKWGKQFKFEMIQGLLDEDEVLGNGVCFAICFRLLAELQRTPTKEISELSIANSDRFKQSLYSMKLRMVPDFSGRIMPDEWLKAENFQESKELFRFFYHSVQPNLEQNFCSPNLFKQLEESHGWMLLSLYGTGLGHAVLMRLDSIYHKVWFFDANVGFLTFESPSQSLEDSVRDCLEFFKDLLHEFYHGNYCEEILVHQLI